MTYPLIVSFIVRPVALCVLATACLFAAGTAQAQTPPPPSAVAVQFAQQIARVCLQGWDSPACLSAVSTSNLALAANYGADLQSRGHANASEQIKQHCAASTAAREQEFPAYAMNSAFTECANTIFDVSQATGVLPDQAHYQLLIAPVLCLSADPRCEAVNQGLAQYAR